MANFEISEDDSSNSSSSRETLGLTLQGKHGGYGMSFSLYDNKNQLMSNAYEALAEAKASIRVFEDVTGRSGDMRQHLIGQDEINEAEQNLLETMKDEYSDLADKVLSAIENLTDRDESAILEKLEAEKQEL